MRFTVTFYCGIRGTDEVHFIEADSFEQAEAYGAEGLPEYVGSHEYLCDFSAEDIDEDEFRESGYEYPEEMFYDSQEYEDFCADCGWDVRETTEEDIINWGLTDESFVDIR